MSADHSRQWVRAQPTEKRLSRAASHSIKPSAHDLATMLGAGLVFLLVVVGGCSSTSGSGPGDGGQPAVCSAGLTQCGGTCVNLQSESSACGRCGMVCPQGLVCSLGSCASTCAAPATSCGGSCFDLSVDFSHCGGCATSCNAGQACSAGKCACQTAGQQACGGQCVDPQTNPANCGACGAACSNGQTCSRGVCGGGPSGTGGATGTGDGLRVGAMCFPKCASAVTDTDGDGYGSEAGRSCVVVGAQPSVGATACVPPPIAVMIPPGDGYYIDAVCHPRCANDRTDPDPVTGVRDGWGYERGATCIVVGSAPALQGLPCIPPAAATGDGYQVTTTCVPACRHPELADAQGYGYEAQQNCIVDGSLASVQNARCMLAPRTLPPPGTGALLGGTCFPPCGAGAIELTADGYGFEVNRACVVPGSKPTIQGIPCIPPPLTVTGLCPRTLQCPVVNGTTLPCGCTWVVGFATRKQQIFATAGASQYFLASAMMETNTLTSNYTLGDGKTGDSFNAGICKQNWGMIRRCHPAWNALSAGQFSTSTAMNSSLALDVQVYNECRSMFGNNWWSGHRNGFGSLGSNTQDIQEFKGAMDWINMMLAGHLGDDVQFWVTIRAI
jgi:Stigma-specific protein, Stig1